MKVRIAKSAITPELSKEETQSCIAQTKDCQHMVKTIEGWVADKKKDLDIIMRCLETGKGLPKNLGEAEPCIDAMHDELEDVFDTIKNGS